MERVITRRLNRRSPPSSEAFRCLPSSFSYRSGAGVLHATWNALAKQVDDRFALFSVIGVVFVLSGAAALSITGLPNRSGTTLAVISAAIHVAYQAALINAYRLGAFNQTYPIARGTSPLLVAAGAYFLVDERLDQVHLAGVAILA